MKKALITGITGQDGSFLAEFLILKGYQVHGIKRKSSSFNTKRIDHIYQDPHTNKKQLILHYGDLTDSSSILAIIKKVQPHEIYNLAAQSHVKTSFENPEYTSNVNAIGTLRILESIRILGLKDKTKYYQASTSELFGKTSTKSQDELTSFYPRSPYAISKLYAYWICVNYREAYNIFACNGILFNHESERRDETFVTRKITRGLCKIFLGFEKCLYLGNINSYRDWGYAKDYVKMQWLMLQRKTPQDYVISSGNTISVRAFVNKVSKYLGFEISWKGKGIKEIGYVSKIQNKNGKINIGDIIIKIDPVYFRKTEVDYLKGNSKKAKRELGWEPKTKISKLIQIMVDYDLSELKNEKMIQNV